MLKLVSTFKNHATVQNVLELLQGIGGNADRAPELFTERINQLPKIVSLVLQESGVTMALQVFKVISQDAELPAEVRVAITELDQIALLEEHRLLLIAAAAVLSGYEQQNEIDQVTTSGVGRIAESLGLKRDQLLIVWREFQLPTLKAYMLTLEDQVLAAA